MHQRQRPILVRLHYAIITELMVCLYYVSHVYLEPTHDPLPRHLRLLR